MAIKIMKMECLVSSIACDLSTAFWLTRPWIFDPYAGENLHLLSHARVFRWHDAHMSYERLKLPDYSGGSPI